MLWKLHPLQRWSATSWPGWVQSVQIPCEHYKVTSPICMYRYSINASYVLGNTLKCKNCPACSCIILVCFSSFCSVENVLLNFKTQQRRGSICRDRHFHWPFHIFTKWEINLILAVDLVSMDIRIILMTVIHLSPTRQLSGDKKLAMASCCKHLRRM